MNPDQFTPEQRTDIEARVEKAKAFLGELNLIPAVIMQSVNIGDDVFAFKPIPFLKDTKYTAATPSPIKV